MIHSRRISRDFRRYEIFFLGGRRASCLFSIYHTNVETVARVYRPIFYSLSSLSSPLLSPLFAHLSHPFVTLHYLLLRNVVDASFSLRCAGKISGARRFAISSIHKRNESTNFLLSQEYGGRYIRLINIQCDRSIRK